MTIESTEKGNIQRRQRETMEANLRQLLALEEATYNSEASEEFNLNELECHHTHPVWREKVTQWCYDVVDYFQESRSVVYVTMNILDRFIAKNHSSFDVSSKHFELASLSSLFLAMRISGSGNLCLSQLVGMSRSVVSAKEIIELGTRMVKSLSWNSRLVTPLEFVRAMCDELPQNIDTITRQEILDSASYFVEISVCDITLSSKRASTTAFASVLNALNEKRSLELALFNQAVENITNFVPQSLEIMKTRIQLRQLLNESCENRHTSRSPHFIIDDDNTTLPTCVSEESIAPQPYEEDDDIVSHKRTVSNADYDLRDSKRSKRELVQG